MDDLWAWIGTRTNWRPDTHQPDDDHADDGDDDDDDDNDDGDDFHDDNDKNGEFDDYADGNNEEEALRNENNIPSWGWCSLVIIAKMGTS